MAWLSSPGSNDHFRNGVVSTHDDATVEVLLNEVLISSSKPTLRHYVVDQRPPNKD